MNDPLRSPFGAPRATALAATFALLLGAAPAHAEIVLDTFGPGNTANGQFWSLNAAQSLAVPFTLTETSSVDTILTSISGTGTFSLNIVANVGVLPGGDVLFSTVLTNPTANVLVSGLGWTLGAGNYWLTSATSAGPGPTWQGGAVPGTQWAFTQGSIWNLASLGDAPAARINVSPVPEPATWLLMLGGAALLGRRALRCAG